MQNSEKYPEQDTSYLKYVSSNGGTFQAITELHHTNFGFSIPDDRLPEALDRLSSLLISPLLQAEAVMQESLIVDQEYKENLKKDVSKAHYAGIQAFLHPDHPSAYFGCGNKETLSRPDIHSIIQKFQKDNYSSHLMTAVLASTRTLVEIQDMAAQYLGHVPNKQDVHNHAPIQEAWNKNAWQPNSPQELLVPAISTLFFEAFRMSWPIPNVSENSPSRTMQLIYYALSSQHEGGLWDYLVSKKALCLFFVPSINRIDGANSFFELTFLAPQFNRAKTDEIASAVIQYIGQVLKRLSHEDWKVEFNILRQMLQRSMESSASSTNLSDVIQISKLLKEEDAIPENLINISYVVSDDPDSSAISDFLSKLSTDNLKLSYLIKETETFAVSTWEWHREKWFGAEFATRHVSNFEKLMNQFEIILSPPCRNNKYCKPKPTFRLQEGSTSKSNEYIFLQPTQILTEEINIWMKPDYCFQTSPNVIIQVQLRNPDFFNQEQSRGKETAH